MWTLNFDFGYWYASHIVRLCTTISRLCFVCMYDNSNKKDSIGAAPKPKSKRINQMHPPSSSFNRTPNNNFTKVTTSRNNMYKKTNDDICETVRHRCHHNRMTILSSRGGVPLLGEHSGFQSNSGAWSLGAWIRVRQGSGRWEALKNTKLR